MKPTKRKAFNFLRSYFDVLNELKEDKDKLDFLMSIINKQFLNEDPKELDFLVKLCYESQRHPIESSVKGWIRANKTDVKGNPITDPTTPLRADPPTHPKEEEEEEKGKEKVEGEDERHFSIIDLANKYKSNDRIINAVLNNGLKLAYNKDDLLSKIDDFVLHLETTGETTKQTKDFNSHFLNWIKIKKNHEPKDFSNETLQERAARKMKEEMNR